MNDSKISRLSLSAACVLIAGFAGAEPSLTIYNQDFAVVRDTVPLELKSGTSQVWYSGATLHLEPASVILRDPAGKHDFRILEQNYRNDPVSQGMMLELNLGKTINFEVIRNEGGQTRRETIPGKIIRSGYSGVPQQNAYGGYYQSPGLQPIIEVNGEMRFSLPGEPLFPSLSDNTILKPALIWEIQSRRSAKFTGEVSYVTGQLSWEADYNLVLPEKGSNMDVVGWITMDNHCGRAFENAKIKLMAGDVNKVVEQPRLQFLYAKRMAMVADELDKDGRVSEKTFDEYHLYTLEHPATLLDGEKKQVEFIHASDVASQSIYIYDGASGSQGQQWYYQGVNTSPEYGNTGNKNIWVMLEFTNSLANHLGLPLPKGRVRLYRRNSDGQTEFTGENNINHTPRDETVRLYTGNSFDLVGERKQTDFKVDSRAHWMDETFEINLHNHKKEPVEVRVVEHLYRCSSWQIQEKSDEFKKTDSRTIEFRAALQPDEKRALTYKVHYTW
jgi:hypothetical protein